MTLPADQSDCRSEGMKKGLTPYHGVSPCFISCPEGLQLEGDAAVDAYAGAVVVAPALDLLIEEILHRE